MSQPEATDPQDNEVLRAEQRQRAYERFNEAFPKPPDCPMGHETNWLVTEPVQLSPTAGGIFAPTGYPVFQLVCPVCGYTMLFNAVLTGVLPAAEPKPPEASSASEDEEP